MPNLYFIILEAKKAIYKEGEVVKVHYRVGARGTPGTVSGFIDAYDIDTGERVVRYETPSIPLGQAYDVDGATVGRMPNRDWRLRFEAIP